MAKWQVTAVLGLASLLLRPLPAAAQESTDMAARMKAMEDKIKALEAELQALKSDQAAMQAALTAATPAPAPATQQAATPAEVATAATATQQQSVALGGAGGAAAKVLNPDIAAIGDFLGASGYGAHHGTPAFEMHESDLAFQAILDPYARADFFISFATGSIRKTAGVLPKRSATSFRRCARLMPRISRRDTTISTNA